MCGFTLVVLKERSSLSAETIQGERKERGGEKDKGRVEERKNWVYVSVLRYIFLNLRPLTFDSETVFEELLCSLCDISQHHCPFPTKQRIPSQFRTPKMSPAIAKCLPGASNSPSAH